MLEEDKYKLNQIIDLQKNFKVLYQQGMISVSNSSIQVDNEFFDRISVESTVIKQLNGEYLYKSCIINDVEFITLVLLEQLINIDNI